MAIIADQGFQEEKCRRTYAVHYEASVRSERGRVLVQTRRTMPTDHIPDVAKSFVGEHFAIHESQTWSGPDEQGRYSADLKLHVQGAPMTGTGSRLIVPHGTGAHDEVSLRIKASVPLIGRRIEHAAAPAVAAAAEIELEMLTARTA
jgi:hypothetical protein